MEQAKKDSSAIKHRLVRSGEVDLFSIGLLGISPVSGSREVASAEFIGFNSSFIRSCIVFEILRSFRVGSFIETGTFRGETSFLVAAQTDLLICTCELDPRRYSFAKKVFDGFDDRVQLVLDNSPRFLQSVLADQNIEQPFIYLDAHWFEVLPLREELESIRLSDREDFIIMIDDFRVPRDDGFGFDKYGEISLEWSYIADVVMKFQKVAVFYPSYPSSSETGARRGFVLIASGHFIQDTRTLCSPTLLYEEDIF